MNYLLSRPSPFRRSGLLGAVIGLHLLVLLTIVATRTVVPQIMEIPLVVDLLQAPETPKPPAARPLPASKPHAVRQPDAPAPITPAPVIEATNSNLASPAAPIAALPESKPAPAAEPVSQARFDVDYLNNPAPAYPPLSRRMGEEGKVILRVSVNPQGAADSVEIKTTSGSQRLDEAAQKTVRSWKFVPAKRGDTPVQSVVLVPIIFKLEH